MFVLENEWIQEPIGEFYTRHEPGSYIIDFIGIGFLVFIAIMALFGGFSGEGDPVGGILTAGVSLVTALLIFSFVQGSKDKENIPREEYVANLIREKTSLSDDDSAVAAKKLEESSFGTAVSVTTGKSEAYTFVYNEDATIAYIYDVGELTPLPDSEFSTVTPGDKESPAKTTESSSN